MKVAYFSMEIGLDENIPTYSGGLGILAGDHIKSAADLNIPLVAITLLYKRAYFIQRISPMGQQEEVYPYFDPRAFMEPLPFKVTIKIEGRDVNIGGLEAQPGRHVRPCSGVFPRHGPPRQRP